ncbi:GGDEF domain-containing protein [Marinobacter zhejiangensis]|uniref:diguanylate cyclase n=1 Tax=Marinobacter zhejiangensis TaxID=488535 RepID=A0A1I4L5G8_9GAMM|nr:GGDEF domain-containing protein [Marinobacter zhejiangensis]SFL86119.1 diguanylate cyclase (GGDEF) domain-containing protein [Marinobacter zhejiangensis]
MSRAKAPATFSAEDEDYRRAFQLTTLLAILALVLLLGIGTKSWLSGHTEHAIVLWSFATLIAINATIFALLRNLQLHMLGLLAIVVTLFIYLFASGGESNTGPLWFYAFPPLLFYLTSLRLGVIILTFCLVMALVIFQWPELPFVTTEYNTDFKIRFLATVTFESVFCFILEFSRLRVRSRLLELAHSHEQAARTDELTGLPNRRAMHQRLMEEYSRYQRTGHHFSVVLIDLDWFKRINDEYGHDAGDAALKQFAELMREIVRQTDLAARWGGEEFLLLLPDTSLIQALTLAERLRHKVAEAEFHFRDQILPVSISAGVSSITQSDSMNHLLKQVDVQLYTAKENGRNQISPRVKSKPTTTAPDSPPDS